MTPNDGDDQRLSERIRREGANAYWDDKTMNDNPYKKKSIPFQHWNLGWKQAEAEVNGGVNSQ